MRDLLGWDPILAVSLFLQQGRDSLLVSKGAGSVAYGFKFPSEAQARRQAFAQAAADWMGSTFLHPARTWAACQKS
jgi:hypothetical protein